MSQFLAIVWNAEPILFEIGGFGLRWYSLLFAGGFVLSFLWMKKIWTDEGHDLELLDSLLIYIVAGTVIGARLGHCLFYDWAYFSQHPLEIFLPFQFEPTFKFTGFQGLASHGGVAMVAFTVFLWAKKHKFGYRWLVDRLMLVIPVASGFIRLANFFNSEIVGHPTDMPWGVIFVRNGENFARHPAQLYESLLYFSILIPMHYFYRKKMVGDGFLFGLFFVICFGGRFVLEYFKSDYSEIVFGGMFMGQLLSIPFIVTGLTLMWFGRKPKGEL